MMADNTDPTMIGNTSSSGLFGVVASSRKEKKICRSVAKLVEFQETLHEQLVKFVYSEKATKFCEISTVDLSYVVPVKYT